MFDLWDLLSRLCFGVPRMSTCLVECRYKLSHGYNLPYCRELTFDWIGSRSFPTDSFTGKGEARIFYLFSMGSFPDLFIEKSLSLVVLSFLTSLLFQLYQLFGVLGRISCSLYTRVWLDDSTRYLSSTSDDSLLKLKVGFPNRMSSPSPPPRVPDTCLNFLLLQRTTTV